MKKITYLLILTTMCFFSCEKEEIEGPSLNDLFGQLSIIEDFRVVGDSASFTNGSVYFTAEFSKIVDWKITITGLSSGGKKIIAGKSNKINAANSMWGGEVSYLPFFVNESCAVRLTFDAHPDTINDFLIITEAKTYGNGSEVIIADFEAGWNPNFGEFFNSGMVRKIESPGAGQGTRYMVQESAPNGCPWDWLIGYVDYYFDYWLQPTTLNADPDNVYFNIMIHGDSTLSPDNVPNSLFKLEFYEDENQDGFWSQNNEDMLFHEFLVDWNGWKMISIKYSDLEISGAALNGGSGNKIREPNKLTKVRTLLLADPYDQADLNSCSGFAKADVDYIVWSEGGPILDQ